MSRDLQSLVEPISPEAPCGVDLEDTQLLASFDTFRIFGSATPLPAETEWRAIRDRSLEALGQSRDLRILAHLAAAVLRIDGLEAFCAAASVADRWLAQRWDQVYPRVDEDAVLRKNALNCLADRMAIVDALRRTPIVAHRQLGSFCLRDLELASGQLAPTEADTHPPSTSQIEATLAASPVEELAALTERIRGATASLRSIVTIMQERGGYESAPDLDPLLKPMLRIEKLLADHLGTRTAVAAPTGEPASPGGASPTGAPGEIRSRQDAIRVIDAVSDFFRKHEPSSPVPLLLERAKRLVSKSFMEVLEDIAPDSLSQVRLIGGIREEGQ
jgi:type VI secretion system protein ImpA